MNIKTNYKSMPKSVEYVNETLKQIEKLVDSKLSSMKLFIPIIFTIVTSVFSFFITQEASKNSYLTITYVAIIFVSLIAFIVLLAAYNTKKFYKACASLNKHPMFSPWNVDSYLYISDNMFIQNLKCFFGRNLSDIEKLQANMLKQKINELRFKSSCIRIAMIIIVICAVCMMISCVCYIGTTLEWDCFREVG